MKIIHTADVHLGARPDPGSPWSGEREREIWDTFRRLIETVKREGADLLLISGDLFHRQPLIRELKEINYLFASLPETWIVVTAGNHDWISRDSAYLKFPWNENVLGLWDGKCRSVGIPGKNTRVYGCSYHSREVRENLYGQVKPEGKEQFHILLAHGGDEKHSPMDFRELAARGFTYIALGHIHRPGILRENRMAYAGALEPIDRNDTGPHGYMRVICRPGGTTAEFVPFASCSYLSLEIPLQEDSTQFELERRLGKKIREGGEKNIWKLLLTGPLDPEMEFSRERLQSLGRIAEIRDERKPVWDFQELSRIYRGGLIGAYVDYFSGKNSEVEQKALRMGVEALMQAKREV